MNGAPQFLIHLKGGADGAVIRVKLSLPADDRFRTRTFIANVKGAELDDLFVDTQCESTGEIRVLLKTRTVDGERRDAVCGELAELSALSGQFDERESALFVGRLANELDRAFADAVFTVGEEASRPALVHAGGGSAAFAGAPALAAAPTGATGWKWMIPSSRKAWLLTTMVAGALILIGVGVVRQVRGSADSGDPSLAGPNAALEARVRSQIDQAVRDPNGAQGYNGMNVALATMRAMGLNPGKANAGCLVGLGK